MQLLPTASIGLLLLALGLTGCATYSPLPSKSSKPAAKAPILHRDARMEPGLPPPSDIEIGQLAPDDPLTPREQAYASPRASTYPVERYTAPSYPEDDYPPPPRNLPNQALNAPAGAAYPQPIAPNIPNAPRPAAPDNQPFVVDTPPQRPSPRLPEADDKQPLVVDTPPSPRPAVEQERLAMHQPAAPTPAPITPQRPADLPPAEITREGNQAVVALLDSADRYVKAGQLDQAGASLERALRIEPRNAGIWHDLAQIRLHQGQYQQAESLASKSNNLASGNNALQARNWKLIAAARKAAGNPSGAQQAEAQAGQIAP